MFFQLDVETNQSRGSSKTGKMEALINDCLLFYFFFPLLSLSGRAGKILENVLLLLIHHRSFPQ
jgi:hypothetical protein